MQQLTCREIIDFLYDYYTNNLAPEVKASFERHLNACSDCCNYLHSYCDTIQMAKKSMRDVDDGALSAMPRGLVNGILGALSKS
jgi:hypothetical protein